MKSIFLSIMLLGVVGVGYGAYVADPGDRLYVLKEWFGNVSYTANVADGITQLEAELADIDAQVMAGTLTPDQAYERKVRIAAQVEVLTSSIAGAKSRTLTREERLSVAASLERLKGALEKYRDSLIALDDQASKSKKSKRGGGGGSKTIIDAIKDTVDDFQEYVEDVMNDDDVVDDTEVDAGSEDTDTTEDTSDEDGTSDVEDDTGSDTEEESDPDTVDDDTEDTASSTVEVGAEVEATTSN